MAKPYRRASSAFLVCGRRRAAFGFRSCRSCGSVVESGIMPGDVIKEVDHGSIKTVADYKRHIRSIEKGREVRFLIQRKVVGYLVVIFNR